MDLLLNKDSGDMVFTNSGTPVVTTEGDVVAQRLYIRLRTLLQEWFLDTKYGVMSMAVLGQKRDKNTVDNILQRAVLDTEGVREIKTWTSSLSGATRVYACEFTVTTVNGATAVVSFTPPI